MTRCIIRNVLRKILVSLRKAAVNMLMIWAAFYTFVAVYVYLDDLGVLGIVKVVGITTVMLVLGAAAIYGIIDHVRDLYREAVNECEDYD